MTTKLSKSGLKDQGPNRAQLCELSVEECAVVAGGRFKLPFQRAAIGGLLMSPDGEPVTVYVDGVRVNSVSTGFA